MAASISQDGQFRAVFLSVIMVLMTQVGYTENMDFSIGLDQDTESKDTGSSTPALSPSVEGADLLIGDLMDDITFQTGSAGYSGSNTSSTLLSGYVSTFSPMGDYLYFTYDDGVHGYELWKTDGTTAGTSMVVDFNNGSGHGWGQSFTGSWSQNAHYVHGNTLYYQCHDGNGSSNTKFCKTDGTASGTVVLHSSLDISRHPNQPNWVHIGNTVYFLANDGTHGIELWKTDGTANGTVLVKDIYVGASDVTGQPGLELVAFDNHLYLHSGYRPNNPPAYMNDTNGGLWKSDGTTNGTVFFMPGQMGQLSVVANKLFFRCSCWKAFGLNDTTYPLSWGWHQMVASDGTYSGSTYFDPITNSSSDWYLMNTGDGHSPRRINAELNGYAFYGGDDSNGYFQLYKTDGTANGSTKVTNFSNGTELYEVSQYCKCIYGWVIGNTLYFQVNDVTTGNELWKTDGTTSGTKIVKDINVGSGDAFSSLNHDFHSIGDTLFFNANDGTHGIELWRTNGTESGTMMVEDFNPSGNSANSWILNAGTSILHMAYNGSEYVRSYDPANIGGVPSSFTGATCSISPALPTGLNIDSSTCTISGTPSVVTSNTTYTVTANISGTTYQGTVWLSSAYHQLTPSVEGADLLIDEAMTNITFQYDSSAASGSGSGSSTSSAFAYANDKVSNGQRHTCAIVDNGSLYCWGLGSQGQLGHGAYTDLYGPSTTPVDLGAGRTAVAVAAGHHHTCAILDNGSVKCWGWDDNGQLGDGGTSHTQYTKTNSPSNPIDLGTNRTAVAISAGWGHTCAVLDNGELKCWGSDNQGELGDGGGHLNTAAPSSTAICLGTGRTAVAVSAGYRNTCAILDNGSLKCWGQYTTTGHNAGNMAVSAPGDAINLGTGRTAVSVSAGYWHACAILDNGEVKCWGETITERWVMGRQQPPTHQIQRP